MHRARLLSGENDTSRNGGSKVLDDFEASISRVIGF